MGRGVIAYTFPCLCPSEMIRKGIKTRGMYLRGSFFKPQPNTLDENRCECRVNSHKITKYTFMMDPNLSAGLPADFVYLTVNCNVW